MRKREKYFLPLLMIILLGFILSPLHFSGLLGLEKPEGIENGMVWAQNTGKEEQDSHYIQLMKQLKTKVDGWLKDLNQRIEREDVTRFEVRFLEILRSFLEWVKEKIDSQIESGENIPKKKMKGEDV
jgi:hypothetical protein